MCRHPRARECRSPCARAQRHIRPHKRTARSETFAHTMNQHHHLSAHMCSTHSLRSSRQTCKTLLRASHRRDGSVTNRDAVSHAVSGGSGPNRESWSLYTGQKTRQTLKSRGTVWAWDRARLGTAFSIEPGYPAIDTGSPTRMPRWRQKKNEKIARITGTLRAGFGVPASGPPVQRLRPARHARAARNIGGDERAAGRSRRRAAAPTHDAVRVPLRCVPCGRARQRVPVRRDPEGFAPAVRQGRRGGSDLAALLRSVRLGHSAI